MNNSSSSSIETIRSQSELNLALAQSADKLVILFYFTKGNPQCKHTYKRYEDLSLKHTLAYFCLIDMDNFEDDNGNISAITNTPYFEFYFRGSKLGSHQSTDVASLERKIEAAQRNIASQTANQINMTGNNINQFASNPQYQQVRQMIINHLRQHNPMMLNQFSQNENLLHQYVMQYMQQNQMNIPLSPQKAMMGGGNHAGQINPMNMMNPMNMNQMGLNQMGLNQMGLNQTNPINAPNQIIQPNPVLFPGQLGNFSSPQSASSLHNLNAALNNSQSDASQIVIPSIQQMQYMFQIWETMNQMGILKTNVPPKPITAEKAGLIDKKSSVSVAVGEGLTLPTGERIIPLGNKKYKIIPPSEISN